MLEEICDKSFLNDKGTLNKGKLFAEYSPTADLSKPKFSIDTFGIHLSRTLLHEVDLHIILIQ